jgi:dihydropyrimidinase
LAPPHARSAIDLVISGGRLVGPDGSGDWDLAISGGQILALGARGAFDGAESARHVDATGRLVLPGGIDPHLHTAWPLRGGELTSSGPEPVSRSALLGGTTTLIEFAPWGPTTTLTEALEARQRVWDQQCHTDYAFHIMLGSTLAPNAMAQVGEALRAGYPSYKVFTSHVVPTWEAKRLGYGPMDELMQVLARDGGILMVHAEDDDLVMHAYERAEREGRMHFRHLPEVHSALSEELAFRRVLGQARAIPGAATYLVHTSAAGSVAAVAEARAAGQPAYAETLHLYATFDSSAYAQPRGQVYHTYPSLKAPCDREALWRGMADGVISTVATDAISTPLAEKVRGQRSDDVLGGCAGVGARLPIVYAEGVRRGLPLERIAALTSTNAARLFGLYPRKGILAPGSDADLVIVDPTAEHVVRADDFPEADYSPWDGWKVAGWPVLTLLRGQVVVEDGRFLGDTLFGCELRRRLDDDIRAGPAV